MTKLTDLAIRKLPIPEKGQKTYFESEGFGVRVSQGGTKTFVIMHGQDRRLKSLGRYPATSLKIARREARKWQVAPKSQNPILSVKEAITAFEEDAETRLRPSTIANYLLYLNQISKARLEDVTRKDLPATPHGIMAGKVFFNWLIKHELFDRNPWLHTQVTYNHRSRVLSDDEIRGLWAYETPPFTDHLKLLLLTGQRRSQFSNFEIRGDTLFFPKDVMKGKADHTIPLLPLARTYAENVQPFNGWSKSKARLDQELQFPHWVIHDLRRTFSTTMAALRIPLHVTERILDHRSGQISGVAAIYNRHDFMEEAREALAKYEEHIRAISSPQGNCGEVGE